MYSIAPSLIGLITAIGMFKASGALDILTNFLSPVTELMGIPKEVSPLFFLKPISGSGSLAMLNRIVSDNGADSVVSKIAAVMTGSTETTFYCIAVYYGATNIKKTGYTVPCALLGDFASMLTACLIVMRDV
ncbi:MAG: nucleoside recognition domain-containing protein [Ruminococcus sp.]|nr:nucleoside recognition domain-containing protein [Ruminococcus sp.]